MLLSKDFIKLILVAIVIAIPLCWWAMNKWLQGFAYRITIGPIVFIEAGMIALDIAWHGSLLKPLLAIRCAH